MQPATDPTTAFESVLEQLLQIRNSNHESSNSNNDTDNSNRASFDLVLKQLMLQRENTVRMDERLKQQQQEMKADV